MTLILTWLFPFGIVMGADSALTYTDSYVTDSSGRRRPRILTGVRKVFEIPKIHAGISFWGEADIGKQTTDEWLSNFIISQENRYESIADFAALLQDELRNLMRPITDPEGSYNYRYGTRGFHLAGFTECKGKSIPTFYHIHNGQSEVYPNINPKILNANQDFPPDRVLELFSRNIAPYVRNGDFHIYSLLFHGLDALFRQESERIRQIYGEFQFPDPSKFATPLEAYTEYIRFWIRLVRDIYALSNLPEIIDGEISVLSITSNGDITISTKP